MRPLSVTFVCDEYPPGPHGGIGSVTQALARTLVGAGNVVRVVGVHDHRYPAPDEEDDRGIHVLRLREPVTPGGWLLARRRLWHVVSAWARSGEVDVVEVPDWRGWAAGWPRLPCPVVARLNGSVTYFGAELGQPVSPLVRYLERASLRRADFWCSASRHTARRTRALFALGAPRAILPNAVELHAQEDLRGRTRTRVVFAGTLTAKKGVLSLARAWPRVAATCLGAELHLFGKDGVDAGGSMRARLEALLADAAGVHFHGHVGRDALTRALQDARLAVFPSYTEAFAVAPAEAMACGCPTVYSERGSGPELISHGRDGLLVDPDDVDGIAAAIIRLLQDDDLAARLGKAGRERIRRDFSTARLLPENEAFYRACAADFRAARAHRTTGSLARHAVAEEARGG